MESDMPQRKKPSSEKGPLINLERMSTGTMIGEFPLNIKQLAGLRACIQREKFPNVPEHARPKEKAYEDLTANGLTRCIIDAINFCGGQAERVSNTGRVIDNSYTYTNVIGQTKTVGGMKFVPGTGTNGTADISALYQGKTLKIEIKIGRDRISPDQEAYRDKIEAAGGIYIVARSFEGFVFELERRLKNG